MNNQTISESNTWTVNGRRYFGRSHKSIPTEIRVEDRSVHVKIKYKTKRDCEFQMVNGEKKLVWTEKDVDTEVHVFGKADVQDIQTAQKLLWFTTDYVMLGIALIAAFFTKGLFLLAGAFYVLFFVRSRHLVITLNTGEEIRIPVSSLDTKQEELDEIKQNILFSRAAPSSSPARTASATGGNVNAQAQAGISSPQVNGAAEPQGSAVSLPSSEKQDADSTKESRFCVFCGQEMQSDWACCPVCGKKAPILNQEFPESTEVSAQTDIPQSQPVSFASAGQNRQDEAMECELTGWQGGMIGFGTEFCTKFEVKGDRIKYGIRKGYQFIEGRAFARKEIVDIFYKQRFCWNKWELVLFPVFICALSIIVGFIAFHKLLSISLTLLTAAVAVVIWEGVMLLLSMSKYLVILLNNGNSIKIPIDTALDTKPFLEMIQHNCDILMPSGNAQHSKKLVRGKKCRNAIIVSALALLISLGVSYELNLVNGIIDVQIWGISDESGEAGSYVAVGNFVEKYCGEGGRWSAKRHKVKENGNVFSKGDVCIEVTYSVPDDELGDTEIRFLYGSPNGGKPTFDVSYIKILGMKCEEDEIYDAFFHMRDMYDVR